MASQPSRCCRAGARQERNGRHGEDLAKIEAALDEGMRNGKAKYYHSAPQGEFSAVDHKAYFLQQVRADNEQQAFGMFYNFMLGDREKHHLI